MDTSLTKALIMVAGVLLAMMVIAFMAHSFGRVGEWAQTQDQEILIEQKEKFNKEYEVFDKDLMYGVDVISCLNKAKSNNDRINDERFIAGETYDNTYEVKVKVNLKKSLEESITVYYMKLGKEFAYTDDKGPFPTVRISETGLSFLNKDYKNFSNFKGVQDLKTKTQKCKNTYTEFELTAELNGINEASLRNLLSVAGTLSEVKKNSDSVNSVKEDNWTKVEFKSALYDLKTRKFKCTNLGYNSQTGRVNEIEFKEM